MQVATVHLWTVEVSANMNIFKAFQGLEKVSRTIEV